MIITIRVEGAQPEELGAACSPRTCLIRLESRQIRQRRPALSSRAGTFAVSPEKCPRGTRDLHRLGRGRPSGGPGLGWPVDKIPNSADLELVREPQRFRFTSEEERSEWLFQTAYAGILEEMCEEGYFNDGR